MQTLASTKDSYYFVDEIENTGLVFGEIIHSILYKALENIEITVHHGEIYDYITNTWSTKLHLSSLSSEAKKTYHVRTTNPEKIKATISYNSNASTSFEEINQLPVLVNNDDLVEPTNLIKYMLRQKTQEFLYNAREIEIESAEESPTYQTRQKKQQIKKEIKEFMNHLNLYMSHLNLDKDEFHNRLYADLKVAYQSINNPNGIMFLGSRQHSQGRESSYTPCINLYNDSLSDEDEDEDEDEDDENDITGLKKRRLDIPLLNHSSTSSSQMKIMSELMNETPGQLHFQTQSRVPKNTRKDTNASVSSLMQPRLKRTQTITMSLTPPLFPKELLVDTNVYDFAPPLTEYDKYLFSKKIKSTASPLM